MACLERAGNHICNSGVLKCVIQIINNSPCLMLLRRRSLKRSCLYALLPGQLIPTTVRSHRLLPLVLSPLHPTDGATARGRQAALPTCHSLRTWLATGKMLACKNSLLPCCSNCITLRYLLLCIRLSPPALLWQHSGYLRLCPCYPFTPLSQLCLPWGQQPPFIPRLGAACSKESFPTSCRVGPQSLCPSCINTVARAPCSCSALPFQGVGAQWDGAVMG